MIQSNTYAFLSWQQKQLCPLLKQKYIFRPNTHRHLMWKVCVEDMFTNNHYKHIKCIYHVE